MPGPLLSLGADVRVDDIAHIVQVALTPVFLLSGVGTLLNVFNQRLARVSDHSEHVTELLKAAEGSDRDETRQLRAHRARLQRRIVALDTSIALGGVGGAAACGAAFALFLGGLRNSALASWLVLLFGLALACVVGSLMAFLVDSVLAWHGLRTEGPLPHPSSTPSKS